jgi:hypothetical protein
MVNDEAVRCDLEVDTKSGERDTQGKEGTPDRVAAILRSEMSGAKTRLVLPPKSSFNEKNTVKLLLNKDLLCILCKVFKLVVCLVLSVVFYLQYSSVVLAGQVIDQTLLCDAIFWAEGGHKTRHPYGILAKYKTTTPRQACLNTIKTNLKKWNGQGDFIEFMSRSYCPIGAKNDPAGLNKHWVKNVKWFYENPRAI